MGRLLWQTVWRETFCVSVDKVQSVVMTYLEDLLDVNICHFYTMPVLVEIFASVQFTCLESSAESPFDGLESD